MIGPNAILTALITTLKANTALIDWLTIRGCQNEVRELDYQGDTFLYPNIRVDSGTEEPTDDGVCHDLTSTVAFRVYCFSEENSSMECSELAMLVYNALNGSKFTGTGFSVATRAVAGSIPKPTRATDRVWRTIVPFTVTLSEGVS